MAMTAISFLLTLSLSVGGTPNADAEFEHSTGVLSLADFNEPSFRSQLSSGAYPISDATSVTVFTHGMSDGNGQGDWYSTGDGQCYGLPFDLSDSVLLIKEDEIENVLNLEDLVSASEDPTPPEGTTPPADPIPAEGHVCLVYSAGINDADVAISNGHLYEAFDRRIDRFLEGYYQVFHVVPRINLIGHSRGGLINMMYAIDHPFLVSNLLSVGTPYVGSDWAQALCYLQHIGMGESEESPYDEVAGSSFASQYANLWANTVADYDINTLALGFSVNVSMITTLARDAMLGIFAPVQGFVSDYLGGFAADITMAGWTNFVDLLLGCLSNAASYAAYVALNGAFNAVAFGLDVAGFFSGDGTLSDLADLLGYAFGLISGDLFESAWNNGGKISTDLAVEVSSQLGKDRDGNQVFDLDCDEVSIVSLGQYGEPSRDNDFSWVPHNHEAMNPLVRAAFTGQLQEDPSYLHEHEFTLRSTANRHVLDCACGAVFHDCQGPYSYLSLGATGHREECSLCPFVETRPHSWTYQHSQSDHFRYCSKCGVQEPPEQHVYTCRDMNASQHIFLCCCGRSYTGAHIYAGNRCRLCNRPKGSEGGIMPL